MISLGGAFCSLVWVNYNVIYLAYMTKRDLKSLVIPLFTIVLSKKLFDDKKSAFIAVLIAPLKRVRRMVISVGFAKTVNAIL